MIPDNILTAVDVGTTKICTIVGKKSSEGTLEFLAHSVVPCNGLTKGNVSDISETAQAIRHSIDEASIRADVTIKSAYIGVTGAHVSYENRQDKMTWVGERGVVTADELSKLPKNSQSNPTNGKSRVIHAIPVSYTVDGINGIKNPVGMHTKNLEVERHVVSGESTFMDKLIESVRLAGLQLDGLVLEPLASSEAVLTRDEKKHGAIVVDIGGGTTDVVAYSNGHIFFTAVLPVGGFQFTNDICVTYNVPYNSAEDVKLHHAHTDLHSIRASEEVTLPVKGQDSEIKILRRDICQLSRERGQELARLVKLKLKTIPAQDLSKMTVVLTGGSSSLPGLDHLFRITLGTKVRLGIPHGRGLIPDELKTPAFATGVGILLWAHTQSKRSTHLNGTVIKPGYLPPSRSSIFQLIRQIKSALPTNLFPVRDSQ